MTTQTDSKKRPWYFHADENVALNKPISGKAWTALMAVYITGAIVFNYLLLVLKFEPTIAAGASNFGATYLVALLFCQHFYKQHQRTLTFNEYRKVASRMLWGLFGSQILIAVVQILYTTYLNSVDCASSISSTTKSCGLLSHAARNALHGASFYIIMSILLITIFLLTLLFTRLSLKSSLKKIARAALRKEKKQEQA